MNVFSYEDYKLLIRHHLEGLPGGGHGYLKKWASALRVNSSFLSQVLGGPKELSADQAAQTAQHFGFSPYESAYLIELVQLNRASTQALKAYCEERLDDIRAQAGHRPLKSKQSMSEEAQARYYSHWSYEGIRLASSIRGLQQIEALAERFDLPASSVRKVVDFLVSQGLCSEVNGKLQIQERHVALSAKSSMMDRSLKNWREAASEHLPRSTARDLFHSMPMAVSESEAGKIKELLLDTIEKSTKLMRGSKSEQLACLNIDWFRL